MLTNVNRKTEPRADRLPNGVQTLAQANVAVFGMCSTLSDSLIFSAGVLDPNNLSQGLSGEAVAVVAGRCVTPDGTPLIDDQDAGIVGLPLAQLKGMNCCIAVAGGLDKTDAILAVLRGGYPTHVVTDERTARELLRRA